MASLQQASRRMRSLQGQEADFAYVQCRLAIIPLIINITVPRRLMIASLQQASRRMRSLNSIRKQALMTEFVSSAFDTFITPSHAYSLQHHIHIHYTITCIFVTASHSYSLHHHMHIHSLQHDMHIHSLHHHMHIHYSITFIFIKASHSYLYIKL